MLCLMKIYIHIKHIHSHITQPFCYYKCTQGTSVCDCPYNVETSLISDKGRDKENNFLFYTLVPLGFVLFIK